jgi:hypothetical protein
MRVHWENDDPLHLNRGRRGSAVGTIRHRRRRGDRPGLAPRGPYDAAHSHRHIARGAPAPGAWEYYRKGQLDLRIALLLALGLFFGAFFGAKVAQMLTPVQLRRGFAVFLVLVAIRVWSAK